MLTKPQTQCYETKIYFSMLPLQVTHNKQFFFFLRVKTTLKHTIPVNCIKLKTIFLVLLFPSFNRNAVTYCIQLLRSAATITKPHD